MKPELFNSLKGYKAKFLTNDLIAGLLVAIVALPMSIALGIQSVPQEVSSNGLQLGIITAIVGGFAISFFGGSRFQIGGPTAAFFVVVYNYIANPDIGLIGLQFATLIAGIWLILFAVVKAGNLLKYMPYPITIGFTAGVGVTLLAGQIKDFLGLKATGVSAVEKIVSCVQNINTFSWATFLIAVLALAIIIIVQKINNKIPGAFFALVICTIISVILTNTVGDLGIQTVGSRYGDIKAEFFLLDFASVNTVKWAKLIVPSFVIAVLCMMESLLSAKVADGMANTRHSPNQELLGQGIANILSPIFGGLPAIGAIARTSVNIKSGAKSSLAGIFHAIFILIMYFSLMDIIKLIPLAVFAAILVMVSINMMNLPLFNRIFRFGYRDGAIIVVSCVLTVIFNLIYGILGGILLTIVINIPNMSKKIRVEKSNEKDNCYNVYGAIYFISVNTLIKIMEKKLPLHKSIVLDFANVTSIDQSAVERMSEFYNTITAQGKELSIENCNSTVQKRISANTFIPCPNVHKANID